MRLAYLPLGNDLQAPGNRRRFVGWANRRQIAFDIADPQQDYDLVYLTYSANIGHWLDYKRRLGNKTFVIYELVDAYLFEPQHWLARLRGPMNYVLGRNSRWYWNHQQALLAMIQAADRVVVGTDAQREAILPFQRDIVVSTDFLAQEAVAQKQDFSIETPLQLVWEGLPYTLDNLWQIAPALAALPFPVQLTVLTNPTYYRFARQYVRRATAGILAGFPVPIRWLDWEVETFSQHIAAADIALIPLNEANGMAWHKPPNKLISFWLMNMPVLCSPTPAYQSLMDGAGLTLTAQDAKQWVEQLTHWHQLAAEQRQSFSERGRNYARKHFDDNSVLAAWDALMQRHW
jgi:hypothetical protein